MYIGACGGLVFVGAIAPTLSAPGVTPPHSVPGYLSAPVKIRK